MKAGSIFHHEAVIFYIFTDNNYVVDDLFGCCLHTVCSVQEDSFIGGNCQFSQWKLAVPHKETNGIPQGSKH